MGYIESERDGVLTGDRFNYDEVMADVSKSFCSSSWSDHSCSQSFLAKTSMRRAFQNV